MLDLASKTAKSIHPPVVDLSRRCAKLILIAISFQSCRILTRDCQVRQVCQRFMLVCPAVIIGWTCLVGQPRIRLCMNFKRNFLGWLRKRTLGSTRCGPSEQRWERTHLRKSNTILVSWKSEASSELTAGTHSSRKLNKASSRACLK